MNFELFCNDEIGFCKGTSLHLGWLKNTLDFFYVVALMNILADENIPLLHEFFADFGTLRTMPGRAISAQNMQGIDVLLVRSVTNVNENLLKGSAVKFVGTCTIGTDHIDQNYLKALDIGFASAPGCNAQSVVDYVLSALCTYSEYKNRPFSTLSVGIVGVGNVGFKLRRRLETLGLRVWAVDPFKSSAEVGALSSLDEALQADVLCLHTPLTKEGEHQTYHLISAAELALMRPDACLLNAGRGDCVDNKALLEHLNKQVDFSAILDVWENEPSPNLALLDKCFLATPHIAGYSLDGKIGGTAMIYQALCRFLGKKEKKTLSDFLPAPALSYLEYSSLAQEDDVLKSALRAVYDVRGDDTRMRGALKNTADIALAFDGLRKNYPLRRDICNTKTNDVLILEKAGFRLS